MLVAQQAKLFSLLNKISNYKESIESIIKDAANSGKMSCVLYIDDLWFRANFTSNQELKSKWKPTQIQSYVMEYLEYVGFIAFLVGDNMPQKDDGFLFDERIMTNI